jgi:hypothetical protein
MSRKSRQKPDARAGAPEAAPGFGASLAGMGLELARSARKPDLLRKSILLAG